ncbi:MAG: hypothetical protein ACPMAQ_00065 [Phycisphaerae bacterium]
MRNRYSAGMVLVMAALAGAARADMLGQLNRVMNGTVETEGDPGRPASWYYSTFGTAWSTASSISPTHSLELNDNSATSAADWRAVAFSVSPGESLNLSFYAETDQIVGNFGGFLRYFNSSGAFLGQKFISLTGSTPWRHYEGRLAAPAGAATADVVFSTNAASNTGLARVDNVAVDNNLILNARMELGSGNNRDSWSHSPSYTSVVTTGDAPSFNTVIEINDTSTEGYGDWRCQAVNVAGSGKLLWAFENRRLSMTGTAYAYLRWFADSGASQFISEEVVPLSGVTVGWQSYLRVVNVPANAVTADIRFATFADPTFTGQMWFDDVVLAVPDPATCLFLMLGSVCLVRRSRRNRTKTNVL